MKSDALRHVSARRATHVPYNCINTWLGDFEIKRTFTRAKRSHKIFKSHLSPKSYSEMNRRGMLNDGLERPVTVSQNRSLKRFMCAQ